MNASLPISGPPFNYDAVAETDRQTVQEATARIKSICRTTAQTIIDIGKNLILIKGRLGHGHFGQWLAAEFDWSERTAQKMMAAAEKFKSAPIADLNFAPSALYLLSDESTPEEACEEAVSLAKSGSLVSHAKAREIVERHKTFPHFLTHLVAAGLLTNDHLAALLTVRDVHGDELIRQFTPRASVTMESGFDAAVLLVLLRPENRPRLATAGIAKPGAIPPAVIEALKLFLAEMVRCQGRIPQWQVAGIWWAAVAALRQLDPEQLVDSIGLWRERHEDALAWWHVFGDSHEAKAADPKTWWGFWDDLNCSGSLTLAAQQGAEERLLQTLQKMYESGQYLPPTAALGHAASA
jgi:hypothetical protein